MNKHINDYAGTILSFQAYKANLYGPGIVWMVYAHFEPNWWNPVDLSFYNCTSDEMLKAIEGHFAIKFDVIGEGIEETVGGIVSTHFHFGFITFMFISLGGMTSITIGLSR